MSLQSLRVWLASALITVCLVVWRLLSSSPASPSPSPVSTSGGLSGRGVQPRSAMPWRVMTQSAAESPTLGPLPASLRDTEVDGLLSHDPVGNLEVSLEVRQVFDYFLIASGEESHDTLRRRIVAYILAELPEPAAGQAIALLQRYLAYRDAAARQSLAGDDAPDLAAAHAALVDLRARYFAAEERAAFFADEEAYDAYTLQRLALMDPRHGPDTQTFAHLGSPTATLPRAERDSQRRAQAVLRFVAAEAELRASGADDAAIHEARVARWGAAAAQRLRDLDAARAAWRGRVQSFEQARATLLTGPTSSHMQQEAALQHLLDAHFSATEQARVRVLTGLSLPR